ncbi:hypothetical protein Nepgr_011646 [Nepenthes gracilis]|uniref:RRM domain-containing protein n=1 Tax=Nepenthes gracilis TaxID=150966 RepID=A0AAD3SFI5_NEPGR|nr:hypothetical protein Nepgr_011646 [Nepenthes gracilis]
MAAASFSVFSFTAKPLPLLKPKILLSLAFHSLASPPLKVPSTALFISPSFPSTKRCVLLSSRFVRNVAVSSEYEQDEEILSDDGDAVPNFSSTLKLFVGNLPFSVDSAQLAGLFETSGTVEMVEVIYDKITGRSRGFGFVTMSSVEEVEAAAQQFNGYELEGRLLRVNAGPPPPRKEGLPARGSSRGASNSENTNRVHVGNLSWAVDDLALKTLFREQGEVVEAKVIYDRDSGRSRGFGFVTYSTAEEVNNAIEFLDGVDLNGRPIRIELWGI